jgi:TonB-linked SusC/RagA family outer membrane protein
MNGVLFTMFMNVKAVVVVCCRPEDAFKNHDKMYKNYTRNLDATKRYINKILLIMRLTTVILIASLMQVSASTIAQQVTLKKENVSLKAVFSEIQKQTGYIFLYRPAQVDENKSVTLNLKNEPLTKAMEKILAGMPLEFEIDDRSIIIRLREKNFFEKVIDRFKVMDFQGKVLDEDGKPIEGASAGLYGSDKASVTDASGNFTLKAELGDMVVITCIGYKRLQFHLRTKIFTVSLQREVANLDEIQVIGYGTSTKRLNTATVSSITAAEIAQQPVTNVLSALNGRLTGVQLVQANGMAGAAVTIKVRGDNTMGVTGSTSSDPLYVVDGIPQASGIRYDAQNFNSNIRGMNGYTNVFSILNKEDVERIDVLKDADATAIYGARGANGVVLITTKKGKPGKIRVNVNLSSGAGEIAHFIPMLNTPQYLDLRREAFKNEKIVPNVNNAPDLMSWDQNAYTDFQQLFLGGSAKLRTADVNASGGSEYLKYYVGLNYRKEGTVIAKDQGVSRTGGLMNLTVSSPDKKFNALFSASYALENSTLNNNNNFLALIFLPPNFNLYKPDGSLNWNNNFANPLGQLLTSYHAKKTFFSGNTALSYQLLKSLTLKATAGYTMSRLDNDTQAPAASYNPVTAMTSNARFAQSPTSNYIIEPQAEYVAKAGPGKLTVLLGGTFSEAVTETTTLLGQNYAYDSQLNTIAGAGLVNTSYMYDQYRYASVFGRLSYDVEAKYLLSATYRRDASSRFGPNNRFANFASVGAAWLFSEEKLIKENLPFLSFGKLKVSYGTTGNDRIDNYLYRMNYENRSIYDDVAYQDIRLLSPVDVAANPNIKWESTKKTELNLSLGFLKDRILFNANLYRNRSSNLLNFTSMTTQSGVTNSIENLDALVQNKGLELELNTRNIAGKSFTWSSSFNISFERNALLSFNDVTKAADQSRYYIGEAVDAYITRRKYQYTGIDPLTGVPTYANLDGNAGIGATDRYIAALGHPFYGGLNNSFSYKGFSLDFFFKFQNSRGKVNQYAKDNTLALGGLMNQSTSVLDRWQQPGDESRRWPLAVTGSGLLSRSYSNFGSSDFTYGNTAYLKLKTASLAYQLPQTWAHKAKMQQVTFSIQGLNLFTIAKDKYVLDPEYGPGAFPALRTLVFALNCSL